MKYVYDSDLKKFWHSDQQAATCEYIYASMECALNATPIRA